MARSVNDPPTRRITTLTARKGGDGDACLSADSLSSRGESQGARSTELPRGGGLVRCAVTLRQTCPREGAICVQRFDDSRNSAIHTTYRISLRSSSLQEPRYPLLRVFLVRFLERSRFPSLAVLLQSLVFCVVWSNPRGPRAREGGAGPRLRGSRRSPFASSRAPGMATVHGLA